VNDYPVARNTFLLAGSLTCLSGMLQLGVAVATTSLVLVTGIEGILGLGPAIFLLAGALSAMPAGRLMDRVGRVPVLAGGFVLGIAGCCVTALACGIDSAVLLVIGFTAIGGAQGIALLARTAAGDMYPPERRARGISLVLFGAVFGAILGPTVFSPLFAGHELDADALVVPWLAAAGIMVGGLALVLAVRPDPGRIARSEPGAPTQGRFALVGGLVVMAGSTLALAWTMSVFATGVALFGLGLGWSFSYVAATSELVDLALPAERGRLIGFNDLLSGATGAALALIGGLAYSDIGRNSVAVGGAIAVAIPALWIALSGRPPAPLAEPVT